MNENEMRTEIIKLQKEYANARQLSSKLYDRGKLVIPGGTARSVLAFEPFPFRVKQAKSAELIDVDGNCYIDFCGNHTAGLFGHINGKLINSVCKKLKSGWSIGSTHETEIRAAELICERFPSIESVRFTNSGTEANLLAISTCVYLSKKKYVLVFENSFHGSLLSFNLRNNELKGELNAPFDFIIAKYNEEENLENIFKDNPIGCVIVEPMQGSGGCILATKEFLCSLRRLCDKYKTFLIFDEVMTSRLHPHGLQSFFSVTPDITTLGKYLGGGFSFGAFGGKQEIMDEFTGYGEKLRHSGTFNNNIVSMTACVTVLSDLYTKDKVFDLNERSNNFRDKLQKIFDDTNIPIYLTGMGSMMHLHSENPLWIKWLFYSLLVNGIYISPNGLISISLAITSKHFNSFISIAESLCKDINTKYKN